MRYFFLLISFFILPKIFLGQVDIIHFGMVKDILLTSEYAISDTVKITYLFKLTDKENTDKIILKVGNNKDQVNIDSLGFRVVLSNDEYQIVDENYGTIKIDNRSVIFKKKYLANMFQHPVFGSIYLVDKDGNTSNVKYFQLIP